MVRSFFIMHNGEWSLTDPVCDRNFSRQPWNTGDPGLPGRACGTGTGCRPSGGSGKLPFLCLMLLVYGEAVHGEDPDHGPDR